jgi:hypothetical protein
MYLHLITYEETSFKAEVCSLFAACLQYKNFSLINLYIPYVVVFLMQELSDAA